MTASTLAPPRTGEPDPVQPARVRRRIDARFLLTAYALPVSLAEFAVLTMFSWGRFDASGDIPPFVRDNVATEVTSVWSHQVTGAGSTSTPMLQLAEVVLLRAVGLVGLGAPVAQWLLYGLCFGLCAFGAAYAAAAWVRRPLAAAAAGLLATFNVYLLIWLPNPLPALAIGLTGVLTGMVARAAVGRRVSPVGFALATLPGSYLALNPPWLLMAVLSAGGVVVVAACVGGREALRRTVSMLVRAVPLSLLLNLWWIVPFLVTVRSPAGLAFSAVTNVRDMGWTHERSSVANVLTLSANWAWNAPGLFPYANALGSGLRVKLHWFLPLLALAGVVLADRRRRRAAWCAAGIVPLLVFVSTGLRSQHIGWVNLWLYDHVPGMWLIRDPESKLGIPLVILYTVLAALAVDRSAELTPMLSRIGRVRRLPPVVLRYLPRLAALAAVLAAIAYPSPLWTGSAMPTWPHGGVPGYRVAIPAQWYRLADAVNAQPGSGKVLTLPVNLDQYVVGTNWGYRGADSVPAQLFRRPTLHLLPDSYYEDVPAVKAVLVAAQGALLAGDRASWQGALRALDVDTVVVRHDLKPAVFDPPPSADPATLDAALDRIGGLAPGQRFGVGSVYHVVDDPGRVAVATRLVEVAGGDPATAARAVAALPPGSVAVTDPDNAVDGFDGSFDDSGTTAFTLAYSGPFRLDRTGADASYRMNVSGDRLILTDADTVRIDGNLLPARPPLAFAVSRPDVVGVDVDGDLRVLPAGGDVAVVGPHSTVTAYAPGPGDGLAGGFRAAPECMGTGGALDGDPLRMTVRSGQVCAMAPVRPTGGAVYRVHFAFRNSGGAKARVCLWQDGPAQCAVLPAPPAASGWTEYTALTQLSADPVTARLYLYGDAAPRQSGTVEYRDVAVTPLQPVGSAALHPLPAQPVTVTLSAGRHVVRADRQVATAPAGPSDPETCTPPGVAVHRYPTGNRDRLLPDGSLLLDPSNGTACGRTALLPVVPEATYRLSLDYRWYEGNTPRMCVQERPSGRCAATPALTRTLGWQTVRAIVRPAAGTGTLQTSVYADAYGAAHTRIAYRDLSLTRISTLSVEVTPADPAVPQAPAIEQRAVSPSEYRVSVRGASGPFTLRLAESYAAGWQLDGLPAGWSARHVTVDGYANGWLLTGSGDATLTLRYRPEWWASTAWWLSLLGVLALIAAAGGRAAVRTRRRRSIDLSRRDPT